MKSDVTVADIENIVLSVLRLYRREVTDMDTYKVKIIKMVRIYPRWKNAINDLFIYFKVQVIRKLVQKYNIPVDGNYFILDKELDKLVDDTIINTAAKEINIKVDEKHVNCTVKGKKALYESIMKKVSKSVKKAINESYDSDPYLKDYLVDHYIEVIKKDPNVVFDIEDHNPVYRGYVVSSDEFVDMEDYAQDYADENGVDFDIDILQDEVMEEFTERTGIEITGWPTMSITEIPDYYDSYEDFCNYCENVDEIPAKVLNRIKKVF